MAAMPDPGVPPVFWRAFAEGDPFADDVGCLDAPPIVGGSGQTPREATGSMAIEVAAIGAILFAAFCAGAVAAHNLFQTWP